MTYTVSLRRTTPRTIEVGETAEFRGSLRGGDYKYKLLDLEVDDVKNSEALQTNDKGNFNFEFTEYTAGEHSYRVWYGSTYSSRLRCTWEEKEEEGCSLEISRTLFSPGEPIIIDYYNVVDGTIVLQAPYPGKGATSFENINGSGSKSYVFPLDSTLGSWKAILTGTDCSKVKEFKLEESAYILQNFTVKDSSGNPIQGAKITCAYNTCVTGDDGKCTIQLLPGVTYSATASKTGYISSSHLFDAAANTNQQFILAKEFYVVERSLSPVPTLSAHLKLPPIILTRCSLSPVPALSAHLKLLTYPQGDTLAAALIRKNALAVADAQFYRFADFKIPGWTVPPFICLFCGTRFNTEDAYVEHMIAHLNAYEEGAYEQ